MERTLWAVVVTTVVGGGSSVIFADSSPPPGEDESAMTKTLEVGATVLQSDDPVDRMNIHLVGLHPMKQDPSHQMDVHHYCEQVNEEFAQCVLFDSAGDDAKLNGIEYIISEGLFESLPEEEKQYWHPHNYEILSGILVAPHLPDTAEQELMDRKINSYGKTWHTWKSGIATVPGDRLPFGEPRLAWSFNRDNEVDPELLKERQRALEMELQEIREQREALRSRANPQRGVDALKGQFGRQTSPLEGVSDKGQQDQP